MPWFLQLWNPVLMVSQYLVTTVLCNNVSSRLVICEGIAPFLLPFFFLISLNFFAPVLRDAKCVGGASHPLPLSRGITPVTSPLTQCAYKWNTPTFFRFSTETSPLLSFHFSFLKLTPSSESITCCSLEIRVCKQIQ